MKFKLLNKPALVVAIFVSLLHAIWAGLVALGVGQSFMDWIFPLHFVDSLYSVVGFDLLSAVLLVAVSFVGSYIGTLLFMAIWKGIKMK